MKSEIANMQKASKDDLFELFSNLGISAQTFNHRRVFSVEDGHDIKANITGGHTKNLFLKDKDGDFYLICAIGETQIKLNQVHKVINSARLSFGNEDALLEILGVTPGSVTLFSLINDKTNKITLILDAELLKHPIVNFHPLLNDATTSISQEDMHKFIRHWGGKTICVDFSKEMPQIIQSALDIK